MKISFINKVDSNCRNFICFVSKNSEIQGEDAINLDNENNNFISKAIKISEFSGKLNESLALVSPSATIDYVLIIGVGDKPLSQAKLEKLAGAACIKLVCSKQEEATVLLSGLSVEEEVEDIPSRFAHGFSVRNWKFDKYKCDKKNEDKLSELKIISSDSELSYSFNKELSALTDGVHFARNLVSEPSNVLSPEAFADIIVKELLPLGVQVNVYGEEELRAMGMGALLAVGQGSQNETNMVVMQWNGGARSDNPLVLVGKGVTFDSGGISIKPSDGMDSMKQDMAGAAAVTGVMKAIATNKIEKNVVSIIGLVENMPSGSAQRPGDIIKSYSGKTIEILNTDAEGRLALADSLSYVQEKFTPELIIDIATLTSAIVIALGHEYAGLFSNCDDLSAQIVKASEITGEKVWRMPMSDYFSSTVESEIADLRNSTTGAVRAGSITAAEFLKKFVKEGTPWAHIDIAGVEDTTRELYTCGSGATGFGVKLLYQLIKNHSYN